MLNIFNKCLLLSLVLMFSHLSVAEEVSENYPGHGVIKLWPYSGEEFDANATRSFVTPTRLLSGQEIPVFSDDLNFEGLSVAIERQLARYKKYPAQGSIRFGRTNYPLSWVTTTLKAFLELSREAQACGDNAENTEELENCREILNEEIRREYNVYAPALNSRDPRHDRVESTHFTGYYTPTLEASKTRTAEFRHGIYKAPSNYLKKSTRSQILFDDRLEGKGLDLFYVKDAFQLYLMHVQGGGRVAIMGDNGQVEYKYVHYHSSNSQPFRFISVYMRNQGYIRDLSIESQRTYLRNHPNRQREIYNYCPSFVYYTEGDRPAVGSGGVSVTPRRSIATDWHHYGYKGVLSFIATKRPTDESTPGKVEYRNFSRFMLDQDTGGAIRGKARVDIFHGEDDYAEMAAFNTNHFGQLFFLMLKR